MDWLNLHTSTLDSPAFVGSAPVERSTWLCLLRFCIGQENGGRITGGRRWKDRQWQQLARVTLREITLKSELWKWDGEDLIVTFYPLEKEAQVMEKRKVARENGKRGGRPTGANTITKEATQTKPRLVISGKAEGEGEGEVERYIAPIGAEEIKPEKKERPRNPLFDAIAEQCGVLNEMNDVNAKAIGTALKNIRQSTPAVTPDEIRGRCNAYRAKWPSMSLTPMSLAKHWPSLNATAGEKVRFNLGDQ